MTEFNDKVADMLSDCAELLRQQDANPFRVNAYLRAAETLSGLDEDVRTILNDEGIDGLVRLPAIGQGLASAIDEVARTGRMSRLDRLRGSLDPEALFRTVPGIGPVLARKLHDELHVDSLEALELAAHDGRLEALPGIGPRRVAAIRAGLASLLGRRRAPSHAIDSRPSVETVLAVDSEYLRRSAEGSLPKLAPRRFNPKGEAWLPVMHAERDGWHFTALFSNTARAHELGRIHDWVVVYFYDDDHREGQHTIVTETHGALEGRRVVRGRERECAAFYRAGGTGPD